jgi:L-arabinonolactonase
MSSNDIKCVQQANALLGEGPTWDTANQVLYWVDIKRPAVFRWNPLHGQTGLWPMPQPVGFASPAQSGRLVFADAAGFGFLDLSTGQITRVGDPESHLPQNRFNDGKVDRSGRVWAGTMNDRGPEATGSLYRLDPDGSIRQMATGFICSNGLGWSPDNRTMYFTDSMVRTIWSYEFDPATGSLGERRVFTKLAESDGFPDGLTVDSDGFVWSAVWDGWRVVRYAPDGTIERTIHMPVQRPSSCMFGGPDLKTLYITSACVELGWDALKKGPLAGSLFALSTEVVGLPEAPFGG